MGLTKEESPASTMGMIHLRKNLLLPSLGICLGVLGSIGEESSASSIGTMLDMPELLRKSLLLPLWG